jgi:hypothetical protein
MTDGGETKRRWLLLVDKRLGTERNDVECGNVLWGRMGWCVALFIGLWWWGEAARKRRRPAGGGGV